MAVCNVCNSKVDRSEEHKMECSVCRKLFHSACVNMKPGDLAYFKKEKINWKCLGCLKARQTSSSTNSPPITPTHISKVNTISASASSALNSHQQGLEYIKNIDFSEGGNNNDKLDVILNNLNCLAKSIDDTKAFLFSKFKELEENLRVKITVLSDENEVLKSQVFNLTSRVERFEQSALNDCVDIVGIPYNKDLNQLRQSVLNILRDTMKTDITDNNIITCYQKKIQSENKINNIVCLKFDSRNSKSAVMKAKQNLKNKSVTFINEKEEETHSKVFINHSLTQNKRYLLKCATKCKTECNVKYLWIRNGNIFMRKLDGSDIKVINNTTDLDYFK